MKTPTIKEIKRAALPIRDATVKEYSIICDTQRKASRFTRNLMQAIKDGKLAVVPCEADEATNDRLSKSFHPEMEGNSVAYLWPRFIKAADTQKIMAELWEGE